MPRVRRYLNFLNGWEQAVSAGEANAAELPHLEGLRLKLKALLDQARITSQQQAALTASKQEASKTMKRLIRDGEALVNVLRLGAREHFGADSEKLVEFGLQPFRGRARAETDNPPETPKPPTPEAPTSTPTAETKK